MGSSQSLDHLIDHLVAGNHGLLMNRLAKRIGDRRVLGLIGRYLRAGVILPEGNRERTPCGVPQGGPLSPLLANVMLDDLDSELQRRGLRFARYADDFLIFVRSHAAAQRVLASVSRFIHSHLRLQVNQAKSKAARINQCSFLGFELRGGKLRWTACAVQRFKDRVRQITSRSSGRSMPDRLAELRRYVRGWLNYFGHSRTYNELIGLDQWLRRRVRLCYPPPLVTSAGQAGNSGSVLVLDDGTCLHSAFHGTRSNSPPGAAKAIGA